MRRVSVLCVGLVVASVAAAQDFAAVGRPRFLFVTTGRDGTIEIDPGRTPIFQRRVTLTLEHATVGEALAAVSRQAGIRLVYSRDVIDTKAPARIRADAITVAAALTEILLGAGVDVVLSDGNRMTLAPRRLPAPPMNGALAGTVTDSSTGGALAGAAIVVEGTMLRALSAADGRYRIAEVPEGPHRVLV